MIRGMEIWREFATYSDAASAEVILGLLRSEDIPARVLSDEPMPNLTRGFCVMVPTEMLRKAEWVLSRAQITDAELAYYATGELGDSPPP
jgi:hypothetical protein